MPVRTLWATSQILLTKPCRLSALIRLQELSINFEDEGLSTQQTCIKIFFKDLLLASPSETTFTRLTTLTLTSMPRIDTPLLRLIAESFPCLVDLFVGSAERLDFGHCWGCFEESLTCTIHSPIPEMFLDARDLAVSGVMI